MRELYAKARSKVDQVVIIIFLTAWFLATNDHIDKVEARVDRLQTLIEQRLPATPTSAD